MGEIRRFISAATAAEMLDVSERTVRRMVANGDIAGYRIGKRLLRIDLDELEASTTPIPVCKMS